MDKPKILCKLTKGKIIDAHKGFVDTWNWIVDFFTPSLDKHFKSGDDSNVVFKADARDTSIVKIDVYYK